MARIKPFKGILYNASKADIRKTVAPPYDVISPAMQRDFHRSDKHNVIRLILGKETPHDALQNNKYTRAAGFLNKWLSDKVFLKDTENSIYIYEQEYLHKGKKIKRTGFIALIEIEPPSKSGVLPHEYTLAKPKKDRLKLIASTKANLSPIFSLFEDRKKRVNRILKSYAKKTKPVFSFKIDGIRHSLWRMSDKEKIAKVTEEMKSKKIFIADGHHRYEVALAYKNTMRKTKGFRPSMNYVMMYFSNLSEQKSLTILSTHRTLRNIKGFDVDEAEGLLKEHFIVKKLRDKNILFKKLNDAKSARHNFGMYAGKGIFYLLSPKKGFSAGMLVDSAKIKDLKRLDVTVLHDLIIGKILDVKVEESSIKYIRNEGDAVKAVDNGNYQVVFFLRPTDINDMRKIALKGVMMPQKSTYFYPKLLTGLVINKF